MTLQVIFKDVETGIETALYDIEAFGRKIAAILGLEHATVHEAVKETATPVIPAGETLSAPAATSSVASSGSADTVA